MTKRSKPTRDELRLLVEQMRGELAREFHIDEHSGDLGSLPSAVCGRYGAELYRRALQIWKEKNEK